MAALLMSLSCKARQGKARRDVSYIQKMSDISMMVTCDYIVIINVIVA